MFNPFAQLTATGESIRNAIISPVETRLKLAEMKEQKDLRNELLDQNREKLSHRKTTAEALRKRYGEVAAEAYLSGEPLQSVVAAERLHRTPVGGAKAGKADKSAVLDMAEKVLGSVTAKAEEITKAILVEKDPAKRKQLMEQQGVVLDVASKMRNQLASINTDLGKSTAESYFTEFGKVMEGNSPESIERMSMVIDKMLENNYGFSGESIQALKNTESAFGLDLGLSEIPTRDDLTKAVYAAVLGNGGDAKTSMDEVNRIINLDDMDELAAIENDPNSTKPIRALATMVGKTVASLNAVDERATSKIRALPKEKKEEAAGTLIDTRLGKKLRTVATEDLYAEEMGGREEFFDPEIKSTGSRRAKAERTVAERIKKKERTFKIPKERKGSKSSSVSMRKSNKWE